MSETRSAQRIETLLRKLDSEHRGEREAVLEALTRELKKEGLSFAAIVSALDQSAPAGLSEQFQAERTNYQAANDSLATENTALRRENDIVRAENHRLALKLQPYKAAWDAAARIMAGVKNATPSIVKNTLHYTTFPAIAAWGLVGSDRFRAEQLSADNRSTAFINGLMGTTIWAIFAVAGTFTTLFVNREVTDARMTAQVRLLDAETPWREGTSSPALLTAWNTMYQRNSAAWVVFNDYQRTVQDGTSDPQNLECRRSTAVYTSIRAGTNFYMPLEGITGENLYLRTLDDASSDICHRPRSKSITGQIKPRT